MRMTARFAASLGFAALVVSTLSAAPPTVAPPPGLREHTPAVHALVGAKIVVGPGRTIEKGTLVIRDGLIVAVGPDLKPPSDARIWDVSGKTLYPGLIDAYSEIAIPPRASDSATPAYWNPKVMPHVRADMAVALDREANKKLRAQGIVARLIAPAGGIIRGTSALVATGDLATSQSLLKEQAALHIQLPQARQTPNEDRSGYPSSPMGAMTLVRQALYDAQWYRQAWNAHQQQPGLPRPEQSEALAVLQDYPHSQTPVMIDAANELYFLRADQIGKEFELNVIVRGSGREYRRLEAIAATGRAVILPLNFPSPPNVKTPESALGVPLEDMLHWDIAPENAARLAAARVRIAFTTAGMKDAGQFLPAVRQAVRRGLQPDDALRALCVTPAELFGVANRMGTLEPGKSAHLLVVEGDLFDKKALLLETWVDGQRYETSPAPLFDIRGTWDVTVLNAQGQAEPLTIKLTGQAAKLAGKLTRGEKEVKLVAVTLSNGQLGCNFKGESLGWEGVLRLSATVALDPKAGDTWLGSVAWADGSQSPCSARRSAPFDPNDKSNESDPAADKKEGKGDADKTDDKTDANKADGDSNKDKPPGNASESRPALFAVTFPFSAFGRESPLPAQPKSVLFKNATLWTCGPQGKVEVASVLIEEGKIKAVGRDLAAPADALVIDAWGKHLSPGLIDCHSHIATDGGVNESGQSITAEVRIGDFINPNDINIYRQLAGGVTCSNILHGSANTIGGQNQIIKLRWGALPEEMKFAEAPPGIKFALGENVKQSNWGERFNTRYPQTRMGVEQLVLDAFTAARQYQRALSNWEREKSGIPPRKDLELDALSEVLAGRRWVHCHSYRQDEILAFLRTCAAFGVKVGTLQHVLEGYKLADVMAQQGVGGSSFSDWWAYKFEVYDAIPYNGALMHNAGVVVSFNSDDAELARRLNTEAAKAVKYGGVPEAEALKFVTLNPARQLRIDHRVGSLEAGKDADLVVWSGSPLSTLSRCEQTWIDGRRYFDRDADRQQNELASKMRAALVQRILTSPDAAESDTKAKTGEVTE